MQIIAIVPMRHESERVPGKNYRSFRGEPLYRHIVRTLGGCSRISEIVIDTDSPIIQADARQHFPQVRVLDRPAALRDGSTPMNQVLLNTIRHANADLYLQTHSTNPLLTERTLDAALDAYLAARDRHDSLFSVSRLQTRLWSHEGRPLNHDPGVLQRTQDLPPVFEENSCLYLFTRELLERTGSRIGARPLLFPVDRLEAVDIDEEADFVLAEALHAQRARR